MAESILNFDEGPMSPDIFSDQEKESTPDLPSTPNFDESYPCCSETSEPDLVDNSPEWKGMSMDEIYKGMGPYGYQQHPPIRPSEFHTVLYQLPIPNRGPPKPYPAQRVDKWCIGYVRMPNSPHSLYPIEQENKPREFRLRWEIIQEALLQSFVSSAQLEAAILSYNDKYAQRWDFRALHHFFNEVVDEEETKMFFDKLLPKMIQLALQLSALITGPIPVLKQHSNSLISLSQLQVASLLANAFFCTFPRRNSTNPQSEYATYPYINFNRLFSAYRDEKPNRSAAVMEKFKCLFHYFRRVTTSAPEGTITIQRCYIPKEDCPNWSQIHNQLPPLHITSKGTIETDGAGLLQVDFANKYIGGGVLHWGCVQEEIRFVICPELIVTMLVTEVLDDTESLIISGVERYSNYEGYSNTFKWTGDFIDETPRDNSGRRKTSLVAIDALYYNQADKQFSMKSIIRELNKAYVGFSSFDMPKNDLSAIATGNWGCGAFRGNPQLKVLIQLMAAAVSGRSMVYFTFNDKALRDSVAEMYWHLVDRNVDVGRLFTLLRAYENDSTTNHSDFYRFLYNRSKMKPIMNYFEIIPKKISDITSIVSVKKISPDKSKKSPSRDDDKDKDPIIQKILSREEEEEGVIRNLLEKCGEKDTMDTKEIVHDTAVVEKKERPSLWDILATKELEKDKISSNYPEKHLTGLDLLGTKPENADNDEINMYTSPIKTKMKSIDKLSNGPKGGQKKILDFFSRKS
ncbi:hypothetical protein PV327_000118 [Microctonus hyperodae]|uniref:poly(ADP-ribose) glycohydrolase n=1 Tax=Microctonus hyperodae TaxID=165561 RepID=A0AA39G6E3_MICHY|nr:hypothetical protein PV327_000118 [Microctonus hyperodae]